MSFKKLFNIISFKVHSIPPKFIGNELVVFLPNINNRLLLLFSELQDRLDNEKLSMDSISSLSMLPHSCKSG
jgi:hypothetical protein